MNRSPNPPAPTALLVVVRHAESTWNAAGRWQGRADPPLSPVGRRQARAAAHLVAAHPPTRVVTSPLIRAAGTARLLGGGHPGLRPVPDPDLAEYDAGAWSGLTRTEIERRWPGSLESWDTDDPVASPGGEPVEPYLRRLLGALSRAGEGAKGRGSWVLVVSHGRALHLVGRSLGAAPVGIGHLQGWAVEVGGSPGSPVPGLHLLAPVAPGSGLPPLRRGTGEHGSAPLPSGG